MIWPKEVNLVSKTQPSGPLCLWQCFHFKRERRRNCLRWRLFGEWTKPTRWISWNILLNYTEYLFEYHRIFLWILQNNTLNIIEYISECHIISLRISQNILTLNNIFSEHCTESLSRVISCRLLGWHFSRKRKRVFERKRSSVIFYSIFCQLWM